MTAKMATTAAGIRFIHTQANPPDREEGGRGSTRSTMQTEDERMNLLDSNGYLFGYRVDSHCGPTKSTVQAARRLSMSPIHVQELNQIDVEVTQTKDERETNYVHQGWSPSVISGMTKPEWMLSRIARANGTNKNISSITKNVVVGKIRVELMLKDLTPVSDFEADVTAALGCSTNAQRFSALYHVFEHWGDVIPLVFELGVSLTITDFESSASSYLGERSYLGLRELKTSPTSKISIKGGDPTTLGDNVQTWLRRPVPTSEWRQVRVTKVLPITYLLEKELQEKIDGLFRSLLAYSSPVIFGEATSEGQAFDGISDARRTISAIMVCCHKEQVKSLRVLYEDGTDSDTHGAGGSGINMFKLMPGESINEFVMWRDTNALHAIQFMTDGGRASDIYGGNGGKPAVLRSCSPDGCLVAFAGFVQSDAIRRLKAIWRHDVKSKAGSGERAYSEYYGGTGGSSFNDWASVKHSDSAHISRVRIESGTYIDGIQVAYVTHPPTPVQYHGGPGGRRHTFRLNPGEHIVTVLGRWNKYIVQICFVTNRGRTSDIYGGGDGEAFICRAPLTSDGKPMRLHYILGKSGEWVNGLMFAWAPL